MTAIRDARRNVARVVQLTAISMVNPRLGYVGNCGTGRAGAAGPFSASEWTLAPRPVIKTGATIWRGGVAAEAAALSIGREALRLGLVVVAARIVGDGAAFAAAGGAIGAGEIACRIGDVRLGIEQAGRRAAVTHGA